MTVDVSKLIKQGGVVAGAILAGAALWYVVLHYEEQLEEDHNRYTQQMIERLQLADELCDERIRELKQSHEQLLRALNLQRAISAGVDRMVNAMGGGPPHAARPAMADTADSDESAEGTGSPIPP